jgi:uncharacterized membrane protein
MVFLAILLLLVLLIVYIRKTNQLSEKIFKMEIELRGLRNAVHSSQSMPTPAAEPGAERAVPPAPVVSPAPSTPPPMTPLPAMPLPPMPPSRTREEWESLIGGKLLNRIGAIALILGVGFFLKYAFDNNWISETVRILIGFAAGALLLLGGARWHKKGLAIFAQGLIGAGIAILYLSVYASFNFYHLVSQPVAFVLMSAVTALTFFHGLKYDSLAVAVLGWAGGFLTPFLLSTGQANEVGLFTYIILLDIGLLAIVRKKDAWFILEPLTLAATYLMYFAWYDEYYTASALALTIFFLTIFWGLFFALDVLRLLQSTATFQKLRQAVAGLNASFYYAAMYAIIDASHHQWMSTATLLIGAVYFLTFFIIKQRRPEAALALARYVLTAITLLVIATAIQFSGFTAITLWALEAVVIIWCGAQWNLRPVRLAALGVLALALLKLFVTQNAFGYIPVENFKLLFNQRALAFIAIAIASAAGAILLKRVSDPNANLFQTILLGAAAILIFILLTAESNDFFRRARLDAVGERETSLQYNRFMAWSIIWALYSLPVVWLGLRHRIASLYCSGLAILCGAATTIAIQGISFAPIGQFRFVFNGRAAAFVVVIACAIAHARWLQAQRGNYSWSSDALGILQAAVVLLLLDLLTGETRDIFKRAIFLAQQGAGEADVSGQINRLQNLQQLTLSGVWLFYSVALMVAGIWRRLPGLRIISIALFGITILKIFIYDLSFLERLYRIFSFIGLGVILLAVSYLYQRYKAVIFDSAKSDK